MTEPRQRVPPSMELHAVDPAAADTFARYVAPELDLLLRVARTVVSRPADAEDLVQDTLLRAYRSIGTFDGAHPRAWLLTIMRNAETNRHRRRRPTLLDDPAAQLDPPTPETDGPEARLLDTMIDAALEQALHSLPERHRRVVELVDVDGLTYAEAAIALGIPIGTVMSRLHRARTKLRNQLRAKGVFTARRTS